MNGLVVSGFSVDHGAIRAIDSLSFTVTAGQLAAVIGANGSGKTTLLRSLSGLKAPTTGQATWQGISLLGQKPEELARQGVLHVSDGKSVIPELTVKENLALGGIWRRDKKDVAAATAEVIDLFPRLGERMSQSADTLSGGERQMLAIGRALVSRPKLLLLDEPSLGLAPLISAQIISIVNELCKSTGLTVLLVEQNANTALAVADHGILLALGKVVADLPARELIADSALRAAYLGY